MMKRPFLDDWIARCCGLEVLSEESLRRYQLNKINEVLRYTERNSLLYRKRLAGVFERHGEAIRAGMWPASPDDVTQLPFTHGAGSRGRLEAVCLRSAGWPSPGW